MAKDFLRLAFVGDVSLALLNVAGASVSEFRGWPAIREAVGGYDFLVGNLECCLVDSRCSEEAQSQLMAVPAEAASFLRTVGFSDLCLANNHILDCGAEAIEVTRECLSSHRIRAFGAGSNLRDAEAVAFADHDGHRVAFLGACDSTEYYAGNGRAGTAPLEKARLGQRVRVAVAEADLVVVTLHADLEFSEVPGRWRQRLSRWLIEQGAHLVVQHHPHVLQGIETYRGGVIAYSLGNFIFRLRGNRYQEDKVGVFDSLVLVVEANLRGGKPRLAHRVVPVYIGDDHFPRCVTGPSREKAMQRFQVLSSLVVDKAAHRRLWFRRCRKEAAARVLGIYYAFGRGHVGHGAREFWQLIARRENRRWILGLLSLGYL